MADDVILVTETGQTNLQAYTNTVSGKSVKAEGMVQVDLTGVPVPRGTTGDPVFANINNVTVKANNVLAALGDSALEVKLASIGSAILSQAAGLPVNVTNTVAVTSSTLGVTSLPTTNIGAAPPAAAVIVSNVKDTNGNIGLFALVAAAGLNGTPDLPVMLDIDATNANLLGGGLKVAQNLLGASDKPDVTANQSGSLKINIVDPYTGTKARVDSNGNVLHTVGIATPSSTQGLTSVPPTYTPFNPYQAPQIPNSPIRQYNGIYR